VAGSGKACFVWVWHGFFGGDMTIRLRSVAPKKQSVLEAIQELQNGRKDTLTIMHIKTGEIYRVLGFDPVEQRIKLETKSSNQILRPLWTQREESLYTPIWR
jgi:hypothetical protein